MRRGRLTGDWARPPAPPIDRRRAVARLPLLAWALGRGVAGAIAGEPGETGAQRLLDALGVEVEWTGARVPAGPAVVVANHLGWLDPILLRTRIAGAYVAKREVGEWPAVGRWIRRSGTLFVDRERPLRVRSFLEDAVSTLRGGGRVVGFPEGTSTDGCRIQPFRTGLFQAAIDAGAPVVPIRLNLVGVGDRDATARWRQAACWYGDATLLPHLWWTLGQGRLRFRVRVGAPVPSRGWHRKKLARAVRSMLLRRGSDLPYDLEYRSAAG